MGDRTLAIWVGRGYYHFTTYNLKNNVVNNIQNIDYELSLEGVWNFIYYSYSASREQATGFVKFGDDGRVKRVAFTGFSHKPIGPNLVFKIGKDLTYEGFNGLVSGVVVGIGGAFYVHDVDKLEEAVKFRFPIP